MQYLEFLPLDFFLSGLSKLYLFPTTPLFACTDERPLRPTFPRRFNDYWRCVPLPFRSPRSRITSGKRLRIALPLTDELTPPPNMRSLFLTSILAPNLALSKPRFTRFFSHHTGRSLFSHPRIGRAKHSSSSRFPGTVSSAYALKFFYLIFFRSSYNPLP